MGVNISPTPQEDSTSASNTPIPATTAPVMHPASPGRMGGTIYNRSNKSLWIKQGDPSVPPVLIPDEPWTECPANSNWEIPSVWDGPIGLVWTAGFSTKSKAIIVENKP